MGNGRAVLIVALSGRALAASARRGGYEPLVADMFGDRDLLHTAHKHVRLAGGLASGIGDRDLIDALHMLGEGQEPIGVVYGTGFEDRPELLARIAGRWQLLGNGGGVVAKLKDPQTFSLMCSDLNILSPEISLFEPSSRNGWLAKRQGGAGGAHIKYAGGSVDGSGGFYYQRKVSGTPISACFLADGKRAQVLGFSAQWSSPTPRQPYRYGGAVRPAALASDAADRLAEAVGRIVAATALVGLNSADFLVHGKRFWLLEINPRPGATLDIFETGETTLFASHVAACSGKLAPAYGCGANAKAASIVYAERDIACLSVLDWPDWATDLPMAGSKIQAGEPVCTVYASGAAAEAAMELAEKRRQTVLSWTRARNR
jgi:uncharacterized protein